MTNEKPTVWLSRISGYVESDCACPDAGWPPPAIRWAGQVDMGEQDCACPAPGPAASPSAPLHAALWHRPSGLYRAPLPNRHEIIFSPAPSADVAVLDEPARRVLDGFAVPRHLPEVAEMLPGLDPVDVARTALQLARRGMLLPAGEMAAPCFAPPHTLTAWLHVTNQCNLRCTYCYVHKNDEAMDEATGRAAVGAIFRSAEHHGFRAVKLKYAGGEPTLNFPLVRALHFQAEALAGRYGLELREVLLSNGVSLSDAVLVELRDAGIRLAISLDGVGAPHDAHRGAGTFTRVARSIDRAIALGLQLHLSITVTAQNVGGLSDVVAYALDRDLPFNLNFYRDHDCGAPKTRVRPGTSLLIEGMRAALALIEERLPQRTLIGGLVDRANFGYPHNRPCGAGQSYVVIDHHGCISRCQMEMDCARGNVWDDDPLTAIRSVEGGFRNLEVDARRGCSECRWRYWCAGGCPWLTYQMTGRSDAKSPYCEVYRALFPEVLRIEGLRLLKWGLPAT